MKHRRTRFLIIRMLSRLLLKLQLLLRRHSNMKRILIIALTLSLGACATVKNPITNNTLGTIIDTYGIADAAFIAYKSLPRCTKTNNFSATNICHKRSVLVAGQNYDSAVNSAINKAVAFQRANPTLDASSYIQAAQTALDTFK